MEIGSKAKKIIVWIASGLAAAGLLTGTFFTGMAVADNTEPASVTSELDGERPERPERGDHSDLPRDSERQDSDSQDRDSQDRDSQDSDSQEKDAQKNDGGEGTDEARPERPDHDGGPDHDGKPGKDDSGKDDAARDGRGERGGDGHRHGHPDSEEEAPAESGSAES